MTGNSTIQKIHGRNLEMLIFYQMAYPRATADVARAFMFRNGSGILFSRQDIYRQENIIGLTMKVYSTTTLQAFEPTIRNV